MPTRLLQRGRAVMALLGVALGALVYAWARRLVSPPAAWVSLLLFVFSPTLLAHDALVTSDMAAALFFTAARWRMWVALHRVTPITVVGAALLVGRFLSKLSGPILVPIAIAMLLVRLCRPAARRRARRPTSSTRRARQLAILARRRDRFGVVTWALSGRRSASATAHSRRHDRQGRFPRPDHRAARARGWLLGSRGGFTCCPRPTSTAPA